MTRTARSLLAAASVAATVVVAGCGSPGRATTRAPAPGTTTATSAVTLPVTVRPGVTPTTTVTTAPPGSSALPVLSEAGPITHLTMGGTEYVPDGVYAGRSIEAVRSSIPASSTAACGGLCWGDATSPAAPSLFVAGPLRTTSCQRIESVQMHQTSADTFTLGASVSNTCPVGAGSAALAGLTLVAVPLSRLPSHTHVTITVESPQDRVPPVSTTVDI